MVHPSVLNRGRQGLEEAVERECLILSRVEDGQG